MASFELLCDYTLWNVDYVVDIVLGKIMKCTFKAMLKSVSMRKARLKQSLTSYHAWKLLVLRTVCSW